MANIVYRGAATPTAVNTAANKNAPLTNDEIDKNLYALNKGVTIGTTNIQPDTSTTTLAGLTSVTSNSFTGALTGDVTGNVTGSSGSTTGNAATATKLLTARTISITGDLTYTSGLFDGTSNVTAGGTLANTTVSAGSYGSSTNIPSFTVDSKGRLTAASNNPITIGAGALSLSIGAAAASNTTVTIGTGTGFNANSTSASTYDIRVGPALTALAALMTTAGAGFIRRGATADTYTIDTNTYLTSYTETDTLASVTGRGATTSTASTFSNGITTNSITGTTLLTLTMPSPVVNNVDGFPINIAPGRSTGTGAGGAITILAGAGSRLQSATGRGGHLTLSAGTGSRNSDGADNVVGSGGNGGNTYIYGGDSDYGGNKAIIQLDGAGGTGAGAAISITGGPAYSANTVGKDITISVGNGTGSGGSGSFIIKTAGAAAAGSTPNVLTNSFVINNTGAIATGEWKATTISTAYGGTGLTTYAAGDILYASATNVLSKLAKGSDGQVLKLTSGVPAWSTDADTLPNNGALTLSIGAAAATNTTVTIGTGTGFTANSFSPITYDIKVGPALTNLAALMTTAGAGFIRRGATADTYAIDTSSYLTSTSGVTTIKGGTGTAVSGAVEFAAGSNVSITQSGQVVTINSSFTDTTYSASTGLTLTGTAFSVNYGTTASTACVGNDSRLSNARVHDGTALTATTGAFSGAVSISYQNPLLVLKDSVSVSSAANHNISFRDLNDVEKISLTTLDATLNLLFGGVNAYTITSSDIKKGSNTYYHSGNLTTLPHNGTALTATTGTFSGAISASNFTGSSSGANTGDQVIPTTLPHNGTALTATTGAFSGAVSISYQNPLLVLKDSVSVSSAANHNISFRDLNNVEKISLTTLDTTLNLLFAGVNAYTITSSDIKKGSNTYYHSGNLTTLPHNGTALSATTGTFSGAISASNFTGSSSGTNTGDETTATIKSKLSITTLSGSNTGDQVIPTTLPHNGTALTATTGLFSSTLSSTGYFTTGTNLQPGKITVDGNSGYLVLRPASYGTPAKIVSSTSSGVDFTISNEVDTCANISNSGITSIGPVTAYGSPSDIRLKENIVKLDKCLDKVEQLNGYSFNYIGKSDKMIGVIAQELEAVAPELVYEFEDLQTKEKSKAVHYGQITAILIEAIKELNAKVADLQNQLANR